MRSFGSDNHSGIHPQILKAIESANEDHNVAYGDDPYTYELRERMKDMFGENTESYVVFSGTGANVLAIRTLIRQYEAIICASTAHINENECGAPECHTGCKLLTIDTPDGKLTPELIIPKLLNLGNQHRNQPKVISITQPSELGTLYTASEIKAIADLAHGYGVYLHVDGARFGNAVAATGISPREMITDTGVDVLSFGGTKNGLMCGEVVVFPNGELSTSTLFQRKQLMQLASKSRFVSAQFLAYLNDDLWLQMAANANAMAAYLAHKLSAISSVEIMQKVQANGVFVRLDREKALRIREKYPFNLTPGDPAMARWMCSFDTTQEDIDLFMSVIEEACR